WCITWDHLTMVTKLFVIALPAAGPLEISVSAGSSAMIYEINLISAFPLRTARQQAASGPARPHFELASTEIS
ncbi:MAG: hypothetical protein ACRDNT_04360, partial [Streptosporangiaceae bacterium]